VYIWSFCKYFINITRSKPHCPTCNRAFEKDSDVTALKEDLNDEIKKIPGKVQNLQSKLKRAEEREKKLQSLLPDKKQADLLNTEAKNYLKP